MKGTDFLDTATIFASVGALQASPPLGFAVAALSIGIAVTRRSPALQDLILGEGAGDSRAVRYFFKTPPRELPPPKATKDAPGAEALLVPRQAAYPPPAQRRNGETQPVRALAPRPVVQLSDDEDIDTGGLSAISIDDLASYDTLLIVGNRGSGKSTLLKAMLRARRDAVIVYDPHGPADEWPDGCEVIGPGREWGHIYRHIVGVQRELDKRSKQLARGERRSGQFDRFTVAADEWGSITTECPVDEKDEPPAVIIRRVLKEGRKFDISFIAGAHGDTAESLGSKGDTVAFQQSFDWIVYCGGFVRRKMPPELAHIVKSFPIGKTPQGGTFPLVVLAWSPTTGEYRLLDMRGAMATTQRTTRPSPAPAPPAPPTADPWDDWTAALFAQAVDAEPDLVAGLSSLQRRGRLTREAALLLACGDEAAAFRALLAMGLSRTDIATLWRERKADVLERIRVVTGGTAEPGE